MMLRYYKTINKYNREQATAPVFCRPLAYGMRRQPTAIKLYYCSYLLNDSVIIHVPIPIQELTMFENYSFLVGQGTRIMIPEESEYAEHQFAHLSRA